MEDEVRDNEVHSEVTFHEIKVGTQYIYRESIYFTAIVTAIGVQEQENGSIHYVFVVDEFVNGLVEVSRGTLLYRFYDTSRFILQHWNLYELLPDTMTIEED